MHTVVAENNAISARANRSVIMNRDKKMGERSKQNDLQDKKAKLLLASKASTRILNTSYFYTKSGAWLSMVETSSIKLN